MNHVLTRVRLAGFLCVAFGFVSICNAQNDSSSENNKDINEPSIEKISFDDPFAAGQQILNRPHPVVDGNVLVSDIPKFAFRAATRLCHGTLFFEEPLVERFGYSPGPVRQQGKSAGSFFFRAIVMPFTPQGWRALCGR